MEPQQVLILTSSPGEQAALATALGRHGCKTLEAKTIAEARETLAHRRVSAVVVSDEVPRTDLAALAQELAALRQSVRVILRTDQPPLVGVISIARDDMAALLDALCEVSHLDAASNSAAATMRESLDQVEARWSELCRWDPDQAPDAEPTMPRVVLTAVADALQHPQPIGWGLDPALDPVVEAFAANVAAPDQTIAQLACLRLALHDIVVREAPLAERDETLERVSTVIDHTMMVAARVRTIQLHEEALTDELTGLGNRRAFDRDLEREVARARRASSALTLAVIDLDGLKRINDVEGHASGDRAISGNVRDIDVLHPGEQRRIANRRCDRQSSPATCWQIGN